MGRKKLSKETVVVDVNGTLLAWTDGYFSGDLKKINRAKEHARRGEEGFPVRIPISHHGPWVTPGNNHAIRAAAAMIAIDPARSRIVKAPPYVLATLDHAIGVESAEAKPEDLEAWLKKIFPEAAPGQR